MLQYLILLSQAISPLFIFTPNLLDGFLLAVPIRDCRTLCVRPVYLSRFPKNALSGHLEVTVGVVGLYPIPRVSQPVIPVLFRLMREPADLIVSPDPEPADVLAWMWARIIIINFHHVGKVCAAPSAGCDAALAAPVNGIIVPKPQYTFFRLARHLVNAQRKEWKSSNNLPSGRTTPPLAENPSHRTMCRRAFPAA